jgi:hypothetical protein
LTSVCRRLPLNLWVPETRSRSCGTVVFVDDSAEDVVSRHSARKVIVISLCILGAQGKDGELQRAAQDPIAKRQDDEVHFGFMGEGGYDISPVRQLWPTLQHLITKLTEFSASTRRTPLDFPIISSLAVPVTCSATPVAGREAGGPPCGPGMT